MRTLVAVDLIGDLDAVLARVFEETIADICARGDAAIVDFKRVNLVRSEGIATVARTIATLRLRGADIAVVAGSKRVKTFLSMAKIAFVERDGAGHEAGTRRVMIAHHAVD